MTIKKEDLKNKISYKDAFSYTKKHLSHIEQTLDFDFLTHFAYGLEAASAFQSLKTKKTRVATILGLDENTYEQVLFLVEAAHVEVIKVYNKDPLPALNFCIDIQYDLTDTLIIPVNEISVALEESDFVLMGKEMEDFDPDLLLEGTTIVSDYHPFIEEKADLTYRKINKDSIRNHKKEIIYYILSDHPDTNTAYTYLSTLVD